MLPSSLAVIDMYAKAGYNSRRGFVPLFVESDTQTKACGRAASNARKVAERPGMDHLLLMNRGGMMSTSDKVDST
jgi:hypothetical protein